MASIWNMQLDYIFFFYGLAFLLFGAVCLSIRDQAPLPWRLLGLFGIAHGLAEWLDAAVILLELDELTWLSAVRLGVLALSFALLLEFGRRGLAACGGRKIGRWVLAPPLLAVAATAIFVDIPSANGVARYFLALPACMITASLLAGQSRLDNREREVWLRLVAGTFVLYGLAAGAVVPVSTLPSSHWLNPDTILALFGVPIQVLRGVLALSAAAMLWCYEIERTAMGSVRLKLRRHFWITLLTLVMVVGIGCGVTNGLGTLFDDELEADVATELALLGNSFVSQLRATDGAVQVLAELSPPGTDLSAANLLVDRMHRATDGGLAYLMDHDGKVLAASNRNEPASLVGKTYSFRPYFRQALEGVAGHYFALGVTTLEPGYYASYPIRDHDRVTGVAVIKKALSAAEIGLTSLGDAHLIDANGIVLFGSRPEMRLRALWPLSPDVRRIVELSRQFSGVNFNPVFTDEPANASWVRLNHQSTLVGRRVINDDGWSIVLLRKQEMTEVDRLFGIIVTLLVSLLVIAHHLIRRRQLNAEAVLSEQQSQVQELSHTVGAARSRAETATRDKSEFLATMSHEIRTPMNAVIGLSQLALRTPLNSKQHDYLTKIFASATALLGIINDILDFSRVEAGRMPLERVTFNLGAVLNNLATVTQAKAAEKGLTLLFQISPEVPPLLAGDPLRLGQILLNLVNNAVKFTQAGEIVLSVGVVKRSGDEFEIAFSVRDTGIGMTADDLSRVFLPFSQADASTIRRYGGNGLGLAIARQLAHLMGGTITAESVLTIGSAFVFTAPFTAMPGAVEAAPIELPPINLAGARVLLVENNEINRQIIEELLQQAGVAVDTARTGLEAVSLALEGGQNYDAVLMGIQMPEMDGFEATRRIHAEPRFAGLPIIAITAHDLERERCLVAGMIDHIAMPVDPDALLATLARWIPAV